MRERAVDAQRTMAEADLYKPVLLKLTEALGEKVHCNFWLETSDRGFSERIKAAIPSGREILFNFIRWKPDIMGVVQRDSQKDLIVVEIKEKALNIENIYQAKLYKEVFGARYAFLVSAAPIPEELKRLCKTTLSILHSIDDHTYRFLAITQFSPNSGFIDWLEDNPFEKDYFWR
jgi:hypothetical protein